MSTVITRIMHKLRVGSDAGRVKTDARGNSVWEWTENDAEHGSTSVLLKRLDNTELSLEDTMKVDRRDVFGNPVKASQSASKPKQKPLAIEGDDEAPAKRAGFQPNKFGRKTDGGGGFNPYG